jgi:LemA protein
MLKSGWFWLSLALAVFWSLGAYNRLVRLRAAIGQQFISLESVLLQYQEVVQQAVTSASTSPQLWANTYSADSDVDPWTRLQVCAGLLTVAMARMQTHPLEPDSSQSLQDAGAALQQAWASLIHPEAFYVNVPEALQQRWLGLDLLVQPEVQRFNACIIVYNHAIAQYPAALLAKLFQFNPARPLA